MIIPKGGMNIKSIRDAGFLGVFAESCLLSVYVFGLFVDIDRYKLVNKLSSIFGEF